MEHLNSLQGALAAIKHTTPPLYMISSAHGVGWWWQVYDSALHLGHHVNAVSYPLGSNATVLQTLQSRENITLETPGANSTLIVIVSTWKGKWSGPRAGAEFIWTVPVSIASLIRIALLMSFVKTQPWNRSCTNSQLKTLDNGVLLMARGTAKNLQAEVAGVAMVDALLNWVDPDYRHHRAERLFPCDPHVRTDMIQQQRPDEVALSPVPLTEGCSFLFCIHHQALDEVGWGFCYNWGDIRVVLRCPNFQFCQFGVNLLYHGIGYWFHDQHYFHSSAPLAAALITTYLSTDWGVPEMREYVIHISSNTGLN